MKKIGKSLLSLILGVCLLASCNAKPNESVTNSEESSNLVEQDETENRKTENTEANTETETEPTKIVVWSWDKSFNGKAFEEADKIDDAVTIDFVEMGKADVLKKIHTVLSSGNTDGLPDIVTISDLHVQGYLMSYPDAFLELSEYINYDDFAPYKKGYISYEGKNYGVPFDTGVAGLFYRSDYIQEAGYTDEDMQNLTWDKYIEIGQKLKEKGHFLQTFNPNDVSNMQILLQSAGTWFTDENGKANFVNNKALLESYRLFKEFNESDFVKVISDWNGFAGAINGGDVACVIRGSWISSTIKAGEDQSGKWKLAPIPKLEGVEGATQRSNQGGSSIFVLAQAENSEKAAEFLANTFANSNDLYNTLAKDANIMGTYLPAAKVEAFSTPDAFFSGQKVNEILSGWISEIPEVNPGAYSAEAQAALVSVTPDILAGADLTESLKKAEEQFNASIQE